MEAKTPGGIVGQARTRGSQPVVVDVGIGAHAVGRRRERRREKEGARKEGDGRTGGLPKAGLICHWVHKRNDVQTQRRTDADDTSG